MKKKQAMIVVIVFLITIALATTCGNTYAKYVLTRHYNTTFSSYPFYFEVKNNTDRIYVNQGEQTVSLNIKNYIGEQYNEFDTKYTITLEDNDIFTLEEQPITGTIPASKRDENIELKLIQKEENTKTGGSVTFVVKATEPYTKEIKITVTIGMLGDYVIELADNKTCSFMDTEIHPHVTDTKCSDDYFPPVAEPHYYKYLTGSNECVDFNYVWYSGKMWRITEILDDGSIKMISENIVSAINFGETGFFNDSYIKQWLNEDFLDTLYNHENILVENASWDISYFYDWCWREPPETVKATVGLLNPYEYSKVRQYSDSEHNFLSLGHSWWLSSYTSPDATKAVGGIQQNGEITGWDVPNTAFGVRPVVILKPDVKFSGEGTQAEPFVLLDDKPAAKEGDKINTRVPGELVTINGVLYRIVNTHEINGKTVTKLKSAEYITDENGVMLKQFGSMEFTYDKEAGANIAYDRIVASKNDSYWLSYLNNTWLNKLEDQGIKKYLVEDTYYVNPAQLKPEDGSRIGSYKNTICKKTDTSETTKDCEKTTNTWTGYVGLPIVGELFAYPLGGNDTHDYKTATMTPYGNGSSPMIGVFETDTQGIFQEAYDNDFAVKPTITLSADVIIKSGDGKTPGTAFKIDLPSN